MLGEVAWKTPSLGLRSAWETTRRGPFSHPNPSVVVMIAVIVGGDLAALNSQRTADQHCQLLNHDMEEWKYTVESTLTCVTLNGGSGQSNPN